ncbi:hypothetical protein ACDW_29050 [Acidovorax sp. DW039]|uniref:hypothetical protein n=1 Tax=Acidovorax sp. DW039 TaxID=3095606 RepID=UPI0030855107|nr:hypothetical protein ACDW_29050 [Acidovorax sp. DW039]
MTRALFIFFLILLFMTGCENADSLRIEETRTKLVGTWLREDNVEGEQARRVLSLGADGKFVDRILVTSQNGRSEHREYAGEWSFDGTNLKRRFLQENGRQYSGGGMRYATFALVSVSSSEFVVNDNLVGRMVSYRKTAEGTQP